ncbi:MAG: flagellar biosynthesis protein FliC [Cellvibrionaceae bacterium]
MPLYINTNVASINAQRQLVKSGHEMSQAMERLSSGKRINTAADDAAGLAIANRMTSQVRGLDQAVRNANDGISLIQTAEGALDETTNILQRMRQLAIQSANGIYSDADRATLDAEVQQLKQEIDRIATTTTFNGQLLLDGSLGSTQLQVGAMANQTITMEVGATNIDELGGAKGGDLIGTEAGQAAGGTTLLAALQVADGGVTNDMLINNQSVGDLSAAANLQEALDEINENISGVEVGALTELVAANDGTGIIRGANYLELTLNNPDGTTDILQISDTGSMQEVVEKINTQASGLISASLNDEGRLILANTYGAQVQITATAGPAFNAASAVGLVAAPSATPLTQEPQLTFTITDENVDNVDVAYTGAGFTADAVANVGVQNRTASDITGAAVTGVAETMLEGALKVNGVVIASIFGDAAPATQAANIVTAINNKSDETGVVASVGAGDQLVLNSIDGSEIKLELDDALSGLTGSVTAFTGLIETNNVETFGETVANIDISTYNGAQGAISVIDRALEAINATRADMGAVNNRLEHTISNLMNVSENTSASRSRIMDADFAAETANLSRAQVLQQASQAMLAQANASTQQVLQLLQG